MTNNKICNSTNIFKLGKGFFSKNVRFSCHRLEGHDGMCRYSFEWYKRNGDENE